MMFDLQGLLSWLEDLPHGEAQVCLSVSGDEVFDFTGDTTLYIPNEGLAVLTLHIKEES